MHIATQSENRTANVTGKPSAKAIILLVISLGLFWFSEAFSPLTIFEPQSTGWILWMSYAKALTQPFAFYFLLCLGERWLKTWRERAALAFALPALIEFGQFFYYRIWTGRYVGAFDPVDLLMYTIGVGLAVLVEQRVFGKLLKFW
jgi:hypothetical protein